jgi:hypothetical protein
MFAQLTATEAGRHQEPGRANALAELVPSARTLDRADPAAAWLRFALPPRASSTDEARR